MTEIPDLLPPAFDWVSDQEREQVDQMMRDARAAIIDAYEGRKFQVQRLIVHGRTDVSSFPKLRDVS